MQNLSVGWDTSTTTPTYSPATIGTEPGGVNAPGASVRYSGSNSSLPTWLPTPDNAIRELMSEYSTGEARSNSSIAALQQAGDEQQGHILTTAMNSANNAATEYSNRTRQAGGNAAGAGLVRAQGQVAGQAAASEAKVQQQRDVMKAQAEARSLAGQIANNIGTLRVNYLSTLAGAMDAAAMRGIQEGGLNVERGKLALEQKRLGLLEDEQNNKNRGGSYFTDNQGRVSNYHGNALEGNSRFDPTTGFLKFGGRG